MRQQPGETDEFFPVRGSAGEAMIEPAIDHQITPQGIGERPKVTHRIRIEIRLRKMPDLAGDGEFLQRV